MVDIENNVKINSLKIDYLKYIIKCEKFTETPNQKDYHHKENQSTKNRIAKKDSQISNMFRQKIYNIELRITGIHCVSCIQLIENSLKKQRNIIAVNLFLSSKKLKISWSDEIELINEFINLIEGLGYMVTPFYYIAQEKRCDVQNQDYGEVGAGSGAGSSAGVSAGSGTDAGSGVVVGAAGSASAGIGGGVGASACGSAGVAGAGGGAGVAGADASGVSLSTGGGVGGSSSYGVQQKQQGEEEVGAGSGAGSSAGVSAGSGTDVGSGVVAGAAGSASVSIGGGVGASVCGSAGVAGAGGGAGVAGADASGVTPSTGISSSAGVRAGSSAGVGVCGGASPSVGASGSASPSADVDDHIQSQDHSHQSHHSKSYHSNHTQCHNSKIQGGMQQERSLLVRLSIAGFVWIQNMMLSMSLWSSQLHDDLDPYSQQFIGIIAGCTTIPAVLYASLPFFRSALVALRGRRSNMDLPISIAIIAVLFVSFYLQLSQIKMLTSVPKISSSDNSFISQSTSSQSTSSQPISQSTSSSFSYPDNSYDVLFSDKRQYDTYYEAVSSLVFALLVGRYLDIRMRNKAYKHANSLAENQVLQANLYNSNTGEITRISAENIKVNQIIIVVAGEKIPLDGVIIEGEGKIDNSIITGETFPITAKVGDFVNSGMINLQSVIKIRVTRQAHESTLRKIMELIEKAEQNKNKLVLLSERVAKLYTPFVLIATFITVIGWKYIYPFLMKLYLMTAGGEAYLAANFDNFTASWKSSWQFAIENGISVLVITCPCALGLAIPVVQIVASSLLMQRGILVKKSDALEKLGEVDFIVFDKTGTLTEGRASVIQNNRRDIVDKYSLETDDGNIYSHDGYNNTIGSIQNNFEYGAYSIRNYHHYNTINNHNGHDQQNVNVNTVKAGMDQDKKIEENTKSNIAKDNIKSLKNVFEKWPKKALKILFLLAQSSRHPFSLALAKFLLDSQILDNKMIKEQLNSDKNNKNSGEIQEEKGFGILYQYDVHQYDANNKNIKTSKHFIYSEDSILCCVMIGNDKFFTEQQQKYKIDKKYVVYMTGDTLVNDDLANSTEDCSHFSEIYCGYILKDRNKQNVLYVTKVYLEDQIRKGAKEMMQALQQIGFTQEDIYLLSGDKSEVVKRVATELEIKQYQGEVTPIEKHNFILQKQHGIPNIYLQKKDCQQEGDMKNEYVFAGNEYLDKKCKKKEYRSENQSGENKGENQGEKNQFGGNKFKANKFKENQYGKDEYKEKMYEENTQGDQDALPFCKKILMVGDGINDSAALKIAYSSISHTKAADISQNSADVIFTNDINSVATSIKAAKYSKNIMKQNIAFALLYNTISVPLAMFGFVTPFLAAVLMSTSSIVVIGNALRLHLSFRVKDDAK